VDNELGRMWKKIAMANFKHHPGIYLRITMITASQETSEI
jgi:hypothetical protein